LKNAGEAVLNIVTSDTVGVEAAEVFQQVHGVPYITVPFPIGPHGTERFLRSIGDALKVKSKSVSRVIDEEKERFYYYLERLADIYNDVDLQRYAVIVADSNYSQALTRFLADDLGWLPEVVVITDILNAEQKDRVLKNFDNYESQVRPEVFFDTDTSGVGKHISSHWPKSRGQRYYDSFSPAFLLGSAFDRDVSEKLGIPHLSVSYPISNRIVLDRAYAGYSGALTLTEDILGSLVGSR